MTSQSPNEKRKINNNNTVIIIIIIYTWYILMTNSLLSSTPAAKNLMENTLNKNVNERETDREEAKITCTSILLSIPSRA